VSPSRFESARALVRAACEGGVTPGAQLSVRWRDALSGRWNDEDHAIGALSYGPESPATRVETLYDLASVTKAIVSLAALSFARENQLSLSTRAHDLWPESTEGPVGDATLEALWSHRAELAAWAPLFHETPPERAGSPAAREAMLARLVGEPLEPNGGTVRYSDLGYIAAGECIARASGTPLDALVERWVLARAREVFGPMRVGFRPFGPATGPRADDTEVAPTEECPWRGRVVQGRVHDENAYGLGGVCGHAGLFGTARDLARIGEASLRALDGDDRVFAPAVMREMTAVRAGGSHRLGWDGKSPAGSSAGARASERTFGHLGFTGTMLWCDPDARVAVALVTNRVHPSRETQGIRALRPAVMDAVLDALGA
jgi:CubicO group peptidase (beta-lactamase class C family)